MGSKVYFMDDRARGFQDSLVAKMLALFDMAGFAEMIEPHSTVAIKLHMGEWNNTAYVRPVYVRALADKIKSLGGIPFVTDTTTMPYNVWASRVSALDHLLTDERNGFNSGTVGCPVIIADGYIGTDDVKVEMPDGIALKEAHVATGIALADVVIMLSHYKGHGVGVIGGAIKNLGVGCASKRGKFNLHGDGSSRYGLAGSHFDPTKCIGKRCPTWELCANICPFDGITITETGMEWEQGKCHSCFAHRSVVTCGAITNPADWGEINPVAIADAAMGAIMATGHQRFGYINLAMDISPLCDCIPYSDRPMVPNIGVFASKDPVAIDHACVTAVNNSPGVPGSAAEEKGVAGIGDIKHDKCSSIQGNSQYLQIKAGEKIGLGTTDYELVKVDRLESIEPYVLNPAGGKPRPVGARYREAFRKVSYFPKEGFARTDEADVSDLR